MQRPPPTNLAVFARFDRYLVEKTLVPRLARAGIGEEMAGDAAPWAPIARPRPLPA
jgi:hypothetical protein